MLKTCYYVTVSLKPVLVSLKPSYSVLTDLRTWLHILCRGDHAQALVSIHSAEDHALTLDAHHGAGSKIGYEQDALANQFLWLLIESSNARADGAINARTIVDGELQELLALLHLLTILHQTYTDVEFLEVLETYGILDRSGLIGSSLISLFGSLQLVELLLDDLILNLLEQQRSLAQLMTSLQEVGAT